MLSACDLTTPVSAIETAEDSMQKVTELDKFFVDQGGVITTSETYPTNESSHQFLKNQNLAG